MRQLFYNKDFQIILTSIMFLTAILSGNKYYEINDISFLISWIIFGFLGFLSLFIFILIPKKSEKEKYYLKNLKLVHKFFAFLVAILGVFIFISILFFLYSFFELLPMK